MSGWPGTCWDVLGIVQTRDRGDIRRAYAARLKTTNPEDDAEGFKVLRTAYEQALAFADKGQPATPPPVSPPPRPRPVQALLSDPAVPEEENTPPPNAIDYKAHGAALNRLQACLRPGVAPEAVAAAFDTVIRSPAMETIDVRRDTEERVAWILSRNMPRSDPVIDLAVAHFNWDSRDTHRRLPRGASQVLQRQKDIGLLRALAARNHTHHKAFKTLSAPPRPITIRSRLLSPAKPEAIAAFLSDVVRRQPSLRNDLNADAIAAWQSFLARPHLANWGIWALLLSGPALLIGLLCLTVVPAAFRDLGIFTTLPPIFALAALAYTFGVDWPQRRWREIRFNPHPWLRWGWTGIMAGLILLTALPVGGWPLTAAAAGLAATAALWVVIVGEPDTRPSTVPWQLRAVLGELYLAVWGLFSACMMPAPEGWRTAAMLLSVAVASAFARLPLYRLWAAASLRIRQAAAFGLAVLALVGILALWDSRDLPEWRPAMVAGVAAIVLAHRAVALSNPAWLLRVRYFGFIASVMSAPIFGAIGGLALGGSVILAWVVAQTVQIGRSQRTPAR